MKKYKVKMLGDTQIDYEHLTELQDDISQQVIKYKKRNLILKFETQLGKTRTASKALKGYFRPLIVCPAKLSKQWEEELTEQNISSCAIMTINKLNMGDNAKNYQWKKHDIIIIDEFQEMLKSKTMKQLQKMKSLHLLGLSATPAGNDNLNYFQVAKTFFHKEPFVKELTKQKFVHDYLLIDAEQQAKNELKRVKTWLPPTVKDKWAKDFESKLQGVIELKRDIKEVRVEIKEINRYKKMKNKEFTRFDGKKFFATSATQSSKLHRLQQLGDYKWNGSFDSFELVSISEEFKDELVNMKYDKSLIVTRTPELAKTIAEFMEIPAVTGDVSLDDRAEIFKSNCLVATLQTVGVGVSSLHHLERIVLIEPAEGQATIEQLKGRIMNNAKDNLVLEIWK